MPERMCKIDGCDRNVTARGMCRKHYLREWRAGEHVNAPTRPREPRRCPPDHIHDLDGCYLEHGCRCDRCRHLRAMERQRRRHRLRAYGREDQIGPARVPAGPVREHLVNLQGQGFGLERIADAAGVSRTTVIDVFYGRRGKNGRHVDSVLAESAQRIVALTADMIDPALLPATGTARRLRALVAIGYPESRLAERLGVKVGNMNKLLMGRQPRVTVATADAVEALFGELWATPYDGPWSDRARRVAKRNRWVGPLAWDDIDDPNERPNVQGEPEEDTFVDELAVELALSGVRVRLTVAERHEAVTRAHALRWSDRLIAETLHISDRTVLRDREALGLEAYPYEELVQRGAA